MEVCRLCLEVLQDHNFRQVDESLKAVINTVAPEVNCEISSTPVLCKQCSSTIDELHKFKTKIVENEQRIKQKCNGDCGDKLSLKEILYGVNLGEIVLTEKAKERICRVCLDSIECESFTVLKPSKPDAYLDSMITMCLPELDLELSRDPVMCEKCLSYLQKLHHLKTSCLDNEEKLKNYCTNHGTNSSAQINLHNVLETLVNDKKPQPQYISVKSEIEREKTDDIEMNNSTIKTEDDTDVQLDGVKDENFDMKTEDDASPSSPEIPENELSDKKSGNKLDEIMKQILKNHKKETHYSCSQCAFTMANKRHYIMHMLAIHTTFNEETRLMHFCHLCDYKTMYKDQMKKHIENEHIEKEKLKCPFCAFTSVYSTNLRRHISIHEDMQDLTCSHPQCDFKTSYKYSLQRHEIKIHGNQCSVCSYKNRNRSAVQKHLRTVHGIYEIHQCDKCNFKTFYLMTLKRHNAREHKGMLKTNFTSIKKNKAELTAEEEEEIKLLFKD